MVSNTTCFTCLDSKKMNLIDIYIMDTDNISYMQKLATCLSDLVRKHYLIMRHQYLIYYLFAVQSGKYENV